MAKSRYSNVKIVGNKSFASFSLPRTASGLGNPSLLEGVTTVEHTFKVGERLDHLAFKYMGDEQYWWIICIVNDIKYPFSSGGLVTGRKLKIPKDAKEILDKVV